MTPAQWREAVAAHEARGLSPDPVLTRMGLRGADAGEADAVAQHGRRGRVAQNVGAAMDAFDAGPVEGAAHDALHGDPAQRADRGRARQEHARRHDLWPCPLDERLWPREVARSVKWPSMALYSSASRCSRSSIRS